MNNELDSRKISRTGSILLPSVVAVLGVLWLYSAAFHAFDDDEFQHANVAWLMHRGERPYTDFFEHHLVLYHGLTAPLYRFGEGRSMIFFFRALSLISSALTLFLLYKAGRKFGASPPAAGAGVWMLGITPMFLLKMTEARPEAPAMLAFAGAVMLLADARTEDSEESRGLCRRPVAIGLLTGLMALLSQKYIVVAAALLLAVAVIYGLRRAAAAGGAFFAALLAYAGWMLWLGVAENAVQLTVMMNMRWIYSFSPADYASELYLTAGALTASGVIGILLAAARRPRRKGIVPGVLLLGSVALVLLVPVPYRQSFLPLLAVLAIGSMMFCTPLIDALLSIAPDGKAYVIPMFFLLMGSASLYALPDHLAADNRPDYELMGAVEEFAPEGPVFDGRALMFWRPHPGYHACMHHEILLMLDLDEYAEDVTDALLQAGLPPVIRDYRVREMPDRIQVFIQDNYLASDIEDVYGAGIGRERLRPGAGAAVRIPVDGYWRVSWRGGKVSVDSTQVENGESIFLHSGEYRLDAEGLVLDLKLQRDYARESGELKEVQTGQ